MGNFTKSLQQWIIFLFMVAIIGANITNSFNQVYTLFKVKSIVNEQRKTVDQLQLQQRELEEQVKYAESSEFVDRSWRYLMGLGGPDDYWVFLPAAHQYQTLYPQVNNTKSTTHWKEWLQLIVDHP